MLKLVVCERCRRHVVDTEAVCPFCQEPKAVGLAGKALRVPASLGTAKKVFFGLSVSGVAATLVACGGTAGEGTGAGSGGTAATGGAGGAAGTGAVAPLPSAPPLIDIDDQLTPPVVPDPGGGSPIYRAPPLPLNAPTPTTPTSSSAPSNTPAKRVK